jgi:hypothetical protein
MKTDDKIQWTGTAFVLSMYITMNLFPTLHLWNIIMGLLGSLCFFVWAYRVKNNPQMFINSIAILFCAIGLIKNTA